jgi:hypothetical protein
LQALSLLQGRAREALDFGESDCLKLHICNIIEGRAREALDFGESDCMKLKH